MLEKKQLLLQYNITTESKNNKFYLIRNENNMETKILFSFTDFIHLKCWSVVIEALDAFKLARETNFNLIYTSTNPNYKPAVIKLKNKNELKNIQKTVKNDKPDGYYTDYTDVIDVTEVKNININDNKKNIRNILKNKGLLEKV